MERIVSLLWGYLFGCFLTAELVVGKITGHSPFTYGSRNPGMTNVKRREGLGFGLLVLAGDVLKTVLACLLSGLLFGRGIGVLYAGVGSVLGHDYPFWHRFSGGEGVASSVAAMVCHTPLLGAGSALIGWAAVLLGGGLPLGAIVIPCAYTIGCFIWQGWETGVLAGVLLLVMLERQHRKAVERKKDREAAPPPEE